MNRMGHRLTWFTVLLGLGVVPTTAFAEDAPARKLKVIYWTGGVAHDYEAMAPILCDAMTRLIPMDLKVAKDASFLDSPDAKALDVILMNHCYEDTKGVLTDQQQQTLLDLVRGGVGVVAIHGSYYSFVKWPEYHKFYGATFTRHGSAKAVVVVQTVDKKHPITKGLADSFEVVSELYQSTPPAKDCHVLATAREKGTDQEFPSVWTRIYGKGRVVTLLAGHWPDSFKVADFQNVIARSVLWAGHRLDAPQGAKGSE
jgi:type 1 glutamine amidotransferase